jgi:ribosomal protein L40E
MKQENEKYCTECGALINIKAEICPKCGVRLLVLKLPNKEISGLLASYYVGF